MALPKFSQPRRRVAEPSEQGQAVKGQKARLLAGGQLPVARTVR